MSSITFNKISANLNKDIPSTISQAAVEISNSGFGKKGEEINVKKIDEIKPEDEEENQNIILLLSYHQ